MGQMGDSAPGNGQHGSRFAIETPRRRNEEQGRSGKGGIPWGRGTGKYVDPVA
jgi:hypothetical protein